MNEPARTQWQIRCAFNGFCKQTLKREAMNAYRERALNTAPENKCSGLRATDEQAPLMIPVPIFVP